MHKSKNKKFQCPDAFGSTMSANSVLSYSMPAVWFGPVKHKHVERPAIPDVY